MPPQRPRSGLEMETVGDVTVLWFTQRSLLGADLVDAIGARLLEAVRDFGCRRLVLNLGNVESMTTSMVGKLLALKRDVEAAGGRLALCELDPFLRQIFQVLNLTNAFALHDTEEAAVESLRS